MTESAAETPLLSSSTMLIAALPPAAIEMAGSDGLLIMEARVSLFSNSESSITVTLNVPDALPSGMVTVPPEKSE